MTIGRNSIALAFVSMLVSSPCVFGQPEPQRQRERAGPDPERFVERLMANDKDKDGKLSKSELPERLAERMFGPADANKDGFLDQAELKAFASQGRNFGGGGGEPSSFEAQMRAAGQALRELRTSELNEASRTKDLELIQSIQEALIGAKSMTSTVAMAPQAKQKYGENEGDYQQAFRSQVIVAITASLDVETAVLTGDQKSAGKHLQALIASQQAGHDAFKPDDEDERGGGQGRRNRRGF